MQKLAYALALATMLATPATADVFFTAGCTGGGTSLVCTFDATPGNLLIDSNIANVNVSGTVTGVTGTFSGGSGAGTNITADFSGPQQVDGLGTFNVTSVLQSGPGGNPTASEVILNITGTMLALLANADGNIFSAHVCSGVTGTSTCANTFFSTPGTFNPPPPPPNPVPLPGAAWLFGAGLLGLWTVIRNKKKIA